LTLIYSPNRNRPDCNTANTIVKCGGTEGQLLAKVNYWLVSDSEVRKSLRRL